MVRKEEGEKDGGMGAIRLPEGELEEFLAREKGQQQVEEKSVAGEIAGNNTKRCVETVHSHVTGRRKGKKSILKVRGGRKKNTRKGY